MLSLPALLALTFSGTFASPFAAPKSALLMLASGILAALLLTRSTAWRLAREEHGFWMAVAAYGVVTAISAVFSPRRELCLQGVELLACGVLLLVASRLVLGGADSARNTRDLQIAIATAATLVALVTLVQFFVTHRWWLFGLYAGRMRMCATLGNPDFVATLLAASIPTAIGLTIAAPSGCWRVASITSALLIVIAILLTGSRGGVLVLTACLAVLALSARRRQRTRLLLAVVVVCSLAAICDLNSRTVSESLRGRVFIWQVSLGDGATRSVLGSGPGTFSYEYPSRLGRFFAEPGRARLLHFASNERHAENDFVEAWQETGWLGLAALLAMFGAWFALAVRRLNECSDATRSAVVVSIASVFALCAASLVDFPQHRAETWALQWILMAIPMACSTPVPAQSSTAVPVQSARSLPAIWFRLRWIRYVLAALLLVVGVGAAFSPLASSYEVAKGEVEESREQMEPSLAAYRAALRWQPSSPDANFDLVRAQAKTGDYTGALTQSAIAVRYVNEPELYLMRSRILQNAGRDSDAVGVLDAAVRLFPYSAELRDEADSYSLPASLPKVETENP